MSNIATLKSTNTSYASVRAACDAMADNSSETVFINSSAIGGSGFGVVSKGGGPYILEGVKQADGTYPVIINLGVNDDGPDRLSFGKAIYNFEGGISLFRNLTARGAEVSGANGGNGAGFRVNASCPKNSGSNFKAIGNQDGLLTDGTPDQVLFYSDYVLDKNGFGREGYTHNVYIGMCKQVTFLRGEHLSSPHGHNMKSRALKTIVQQTRCSGSAQGRELDLSNGGIWESSNSEYIKPSVADQGNLIHIGPEGINDGRPEKYTSTNDLFQIDVEPNGRGLEFLKNDGRVECVLTDPKFVLAGKVLTDAEARPYLTGNIRIVDTGGKRGPLLPVGCAGDIKAGGTAPAVVDQPAPAPAPAPAPTPTPASPAPTPAPTPVPATGTTDTWVKIGDENANVTVDANTVVRYGTAGKWVEKTVSGAFKATNDFFGRDPATGIIKSVEKKVSAAPAPVVTPPPVVPTVPVPAISLAAVPMDAMVAGCRAFLEAVGFAVSKK